MGTLGAVLSYCCSTHEARFFGALMDTLFLGLYECAPSAVKQRQAKLNSVCSLEQCLLLLHGVLRGRAPVRIPLKGRIWGGWSCSSADLGFCSARSSAATPSPRGERRHERDVAPRFGPKEVTKCPLRVKDLVECMVTDDLGMHFAALNHLKQRQIEWSDMEQRLRVYESCLCSRVCVLRDDTPIGGATAVPTLTIQYAVFSHGSRPNGQGKIGVSKGNKRRHKLAETSA